MTDINALAPVPAKTPPDAKAAQAARTAEEFEAVFLSQFVDEMMKTAGSTAFGTEQSAEMWRSFMSDAVARQIASQGGLGLAGPIEGIIAAYTASADLKEEP